MLSKNYLSKKRFISIHIFFILEINRLSPQDAVLDYGPLGNFSLAGFEMVLTRYVSTYIITYYLPSGTSKQTIFQFQHGYIREGLKNRKK